MAPISAQDRTTGTVQGVVVDARTGSALPKILIVVEGGPSAETDPEGRFSLPELTPGPVRLYVSAVGYGLVQRTLHLAPGAVVDVRIPLSEGAATYTETVTVHADRFRRPEPGVPAQQGLSGADLQNLRGVVADDALRAVQVLPGVATGDDFRSEFSVRGSDFSHMNFTVDGFATPFLMHMVRAVEDRANTGSVAMINSDVLEDVTLLNGGYAQRSGNRTGAELALTVRDGSRDRRLLRLSVSGTSASMTAEGPLGRARRGSWLVSGRKSYLDLLIDRLAEEGLSFGFADIQAKLRYDLTSRQSAALTFITGDSRLRELPEQADEADLFVGDNASAIVIGSWRAAFTRGLLTAGVMGATNAFDNHTDADVKLEEGTNDQVVARADLSLGLGRGIELESGVLSEYTREFLRKQRLTQTTPVVTNDYRADARRDGAYARLRLNLSQRLMIAPGARVDHFQLTHQTTASPWVQTELILPRGIALRMATGLYQQFPDFEEVVGNLAGTGMLPEKALHADVSVEQRVSSATRVQITFYDRRDDRLIRRPGADTRLVAGRLVRGSSTAPYENRLDGHARGVELLLQRSSPTALSGWLSYAYGRNRYEDQVAGEEYWGDLDQRHTLNAYAFYRFSHRFSGSAKFRMGSNFPIPGYYTQEGAKYFVSDTRNTERLPSYARLDLRANRTFDWSRKRLTLFVEVLNVLNRENVRFNPPRVSALTREVTRLFDSLVPVVPSAGVLFEF
jgi:TonB dependent receptor-like, beta-barrel/Carboxypeptidase regulatory-like domain/TonB-dependent Receptor Plug Domain